MITCYHFIKTGDFSDSIKIAEILVDDDHDLIQKAVGWMLREVGNRDLAVEESFLKKHYETMPRTMLRYAIEKFEEPLRLQYLNGEI
ncbi:MAG TPA: DNA alkylation repair protein [Gracilimonas sp.]|nr:DNA alkylation repair protein [Gracilimonas sp.]